MKFTIKEILKITKGRLVTGQKNILLNGVSINSKKVKKNDLFIAIKGLNHDGHRFIEEAAKAGAQTAVVSKKFLTTKEGKNLCSRRQSDLNIISVDDTVKALGAIARAHRMKFKIPVIAITGSSGKTTTKDMIASVLQDRFKVLKPKGSENNHIGVPMTLLQLKSSHQAAVLELGTNHPGEIRYLTKLSIPTVAVLTNIGESHLAHLKSVAGVFKEKSDLVRFMAPQGHVIYNADNPYLSKLSSYKRVRRLIRYGFKSSNDFRVSSCQLILNRKWAFTVNDRFSLTLNSPVREYIYNALAAFCCGRLFDISYNNISKHINRFKPYLGRQNFKRTANFLIIDDSYNANPVSVRNAVETISRLKIRGKRIFVLGDMLELGTASRRLHCQMGEGILQSNVDIFLGFGPLTKYTVNSIAKAKSRIKPIHFKNIHSLNKKLIALSHPGDVVLIKGSRGMQMERTVKAFINHIEK